MTDHQQNYDDWYAKLGPPADAKEAEARRIAVQLMRDAVDGLPGASLPPARRRSGLLPVLLALAVLVGPWCLPLGVVVGVVAMTLCLTGDVRLWRAWWLVPPTACVGQFWIAELAFMFAFHGFSWTLY